MSQDIVDTTNLGGDMSDRGRYIVEAIVLEHRSPSELARTHKVSRSWIYKMLERFKRSCAHQVEARVQKLILKLRRDLTAAEDDPERAVRAALEIRRGISESPVTAGEVVSSAQRLQVAAPVSAILVGEQTYRTTREVIDYSEAAPTAAKAGAGAILAWHALAALPRRGVDLVREPRTPLVGRKRELELLVSTLTRAIEERSPQFVTLVGVPGIGKSRLVFELSKRFDQEREQITWRQGRCLSYGDGVSFWALGEIVKAQAGILETDRPDQAEEKLRTAVAALPLTMDEATWVEREIWPLIGSSGERSPEERSEERFAAWRCFLEAMAERKPLVLALEDLHWADDGLLDFLEELADRLRDAPLLVLCTARPEFLERRPAWGGGKTNVVTIALAPLSEDETGQLLEAVLEQRELEAEVREALVARAAGNPLYAEQFARVLEEIGAVQQLPETVQGIIAARIDGLPLADKAVLQDAAVIGKVFWPGAVEAIGDIPHREVRGRLVSLERKEFVQQARRSSVVGEPEYSFRHILLRDVAYAQIPRAARGERHRRAAGWIQSPGRPDDHAECSPITTSRRWTTRGQRNKVTRRWPSMRAWRDGRPASAHSLSHPMPPLRGSTVRRSSFGPKAMPPASRSSSRRAARDMPPTERALTCSSRHSSSWLRTETLRRLRKLGSISRAASGFLVTATGRMNTSTARSHSPMTAGTRAPELTRS